MAKKNYLIEGGSGTGKSSVCRELKRRGYKVVDGDNELAYRGDPETGKRVDISRESLDFQYRMWVWDIDKVQVIAANQDDEIVFFCGGSRNHQKYIDVFEKVFVLDIDVDTLKERLQSREPDDWGGNNEEKEFILRMHHSKDATIPEGIVIDTSRSLNKVVDAILEYIEA